MQIGEVTVTFRVRVEIVNEDGTTETVTLSSTLKDAMAALLTAHVENKAAEVRALPDKPQ